MKKLLAGALISSCIVFAGCDKDLPSVDEMTKMANIAGVTTGYVINMTGVDNASKVVITNIMNQVRSAIPGKDQRFSDVWIPIADKYISELVDTGKIDQIQAGLIDKAVIVVVKGIDYVVFIKYPKIGDNVELISAAANGFCDGFLSVIKVDCSECKDLLESGKINKELYDYLTK